MNNMNTGGARRNGYGHKAGNKNPKGARGQGRPQGNFETGRWGNKAAEPQPQQHQSLAEVLQSKTLTEAEQMAVPVFVHGLPNNLCNSMMMEAILEQAGLEDAIVSVEAVPGSQYGEAVLRLATWEAASYTLRHFDGCRWDSAVGVTAEIGGQGQVYGWGTTAPAVVSSDSYNGGFVNTSKVQNVQAKDSKPVEAEICKKKSKPVVTELKSVGTPQISPLASPTLTAASTTVPPSPASLPASSPFYTSKGQLASRKVSWADLTDDDDDEISLGLALDDTTDDTESGSARAGSSDDGF